MRFVQKLTLAKRSKNLWSTPIISYKQHNTEHSFIQNAYCVLGQTRPTSPTLPTHVATFSKASQYRQIAVYKASASVQSVCDWLVHPSRPCFLPQNSERRALSLLGHFQCPTSLDQQRLIFTTTVCTYPCHLSGAFTFHLPRYLTT